MKKICIIFRRAPHGTSNGREGLDLALLCATYEQNVAIIFVDEGIFHLIKSQKPENIGAKDYIATLKALPMYEIDNVFVCRKSLKDYGINANELTLSLTEISVEEINKQIQFANEVLVF